MSESDPVEEFENKLKKMTLNELQAYGKLLDEKIKQSIGSLNRERILQVHFTPQSPLILHACMRLMSNQL